MSQDLREDISKIFNFLATGLGNMPISQPIISAQKRSDITGVLDSLTNEFGQARESIRLSDKFVSLQISKMEAGLKELKSLVGGESKPFIDSINPLDSSRGNTWRDPRAGYKLKGKVTNLQEDLAKLVGEINKQGDKLKQFEDICGKQKAKIQTIAREPQKTSSPTEAQFYNKEVAYINLLKKKDEEIAGLEKEINEIAEKAKNSIEMSVQEQSRSENSSILEKLCNEVKKFISVIDNLKKAVGKKDEKLIDNYRQEFDNQKQILQSLISLRRASPIKIPENEGQTERENLEKQCEKQSQDILKLQNNLLEYVEQIKSQEREIERLQQELNSSTARKKSVSDENEDKIKGIDLKEILNDITRKTETAAEDIMGEYGMKAQELNEKINQSRDKLNRLQNALQNIKPSNGNLEDELYQLQQDKDALEERNKTIAKEKSDLKENIKRLEEKIKVIEKEKNDVIEYKETLEEKIKTIEKEKSDLNEKIDQLTISLQEIENLHEEDIQKLNNYQEIFKQINEFTNECIAKSNETTINLLDEKNKQVDKLKESFETCVNSLIEQINAHVDEIEKLQQTINTLKDENAKLVSDNVGESSQAQIEALQEELKNKETQISNYEEEKQALLQKSDGMDASQIKQQNETIELLLNLLGQNSAILLESNKYLEGIEQNADERIEQAKILSNNQENTIGAYRKALELIKNLLQQKQHPVQEEEILKLKENSKKLEDKLNFQIEENKKITQEKEKLEKACQEFETNINENTYTISQLSDEKSGLEKEIADLKKENEAILSKQLASNDKPQIDIHAKVEEAIKICRQEVNEIKAQCLNEIDAVKANMANFNHDLLAIAKELMEKYEIAKKKITRMIIVNSQAKGNISDLKNDLGEMKVEMGNYKENMDACIEAIQNRFIEEEYRKEDPNKKVELLVEIKKSLSSFREEHKSIAENMASYQDYINSTREMFVQNKNFNQRKTQEMKINLNENIKNLRIMLNDIKEEQDNIVELFPKCAQRMIEMVKIKGACKDSGEKLIFGMQKISADVQNLKENWEANKKLFGNNIYKLAKDNANLLNRIKGSVNLTLADWKGKFEAIDLELNGLDAKQLEQVRVIEKVSAEYSQLKADLQQREGTILELNAKCEELEKNNRDLNSKIEEKDKNIYELELDLDSKKNEIEESKLLLKSGNSEDKERIAKLDEENSELRRKCIEIQEQSDLANNRMARMSQLTIDFKNYVAESLGLLKFMFLNIIDMQAENTNDLQKVLKEELNKIQKGNKAKMTLKLQKMIESIQKLKNQILEVKNAHDIILESIKNCNVAFKLLSNKNKELEGKNKELQENEQSMLQKINKSIEFERKRGEIQRFASGFILESKETLRTIKEEQKLITDNQAKYAKEILKSHKNDIINAQEEVKFTFSLSLQNVNEALKETKETNLQLKNDFAEYYEQANKCKKALIWLNDENNNLKQQIGNLKEESEKLSEKCGELSNKLEESQSKCKEIEDSSLSLLQAKDKEIEEIKLTVSSSQSDEKDKIAKLLQEKSDLENKLIESQQEQGKINEEKSAECEKQKRSQEEYRIKIGGYLQEFKNDWNAFKVDIDISKDISSYSSIFSQMIQKKALELMQKDEINKKIEEDAIKTLVISLSKIPEYEGKLSKISFSDAAKFASETINSLIMPKGVTESIKEMAKGMNQKFVDLQEVIDNKYVQHSQAIQKITQDISIGNKANSDKLHKILKEFSEIKEEKDKCKAILISIIKENKFPQEKVDNFEDICIIIKDSLNAKKSTQLKEKEKIMGSMTQFMSHCTKHFSDSDAKISILAKKSSSVMESFAKRIEEAVAENNELMNSIKSLSAVVSEKEEKIKDAENNILTMLGFNGVPIVEGQQISLDELIKKVDELLNTLSSNQNEKNPSVNNSLDQQNVEPLDFEGEDDLIASLAVEEPAKEEKEEGLEPEAAPKSGVDKKLEEIEAENKNLKEECVRLQQIIEEMEKNNEIRDASDLKWHNEYDTIKEYIKELVEKYDIPKSGSIISEMDQIIERFNSEIEQLKQIQMDSEEQTKAQLLEKEAKLTKSEKELEDFKLAVFFGIYNN